MGINRTKSRTPPSTTFALQAWSRVAHLSFHATLWFCSVVFVLNCVVLIVARQVSRPKVKKKKSKKGGKWECFCGEEQRKASIPVDPGVGRFVDSWLGEMESRPVASWPSVQSPPALAKQLIPVIFFPVVVLPRLCQCTDAQASCSLTGWSA